MSYTHPWHQTCSGHTTWDLMYAGSTHEHLLHAVMGRNDLDRILVLTWRMSNSRLIAGPLWCRVTVLTAGVASAATEARTMHLTRATTAICVCRENLQGCDLR